MPNELTPRDVLARLRDRLPGIAREMARKFADQYGYWPTDRADLAVSFTAALGWGIVVELSRLMRSTGEVAPDVASMDLEPLREAWIVAFTSQNNARDADSMN